MAHRQRRASVHLHVRSLESLPPAPPSPASRERIGPCPLCSSHRSSADGRDLYGRPTSSIWFHIPRRHRVWIVILFLLNSYCQFINQAPFASAPRQRGLARELSCRISSI